MYNSATCLNLTQVEATFKDFNPLASPVQKTVQDVCDKFVAVGKNLPIVLGAIGTIAGGSVAFGMFGAIPASLALAGLA